MSQVKIGISTSGGDFKTMDDLLVTSNIPIEPDASHVPFSVIQKLGNGLMQGQGYAVVKWRWNHMLLENRYILRNTYCPYPALSTPNIYIYTPITNTDSSGNLIYATFQTVLNWPTQDEDYQAGHELGLLLTFTQLVLIP